MNKVMSLHDAVAKYVENGDTLAIGGFTTNRKPYATVSEILRQGQKDFIVYAGPGGGTEDDPAGTFYIGWAYRSADGEVPVVDSVRCHYEGDRSCVRAHAVAEALGRIALVLNSME